MHEILVSSQAGRDLRRAPAVILQRVVRAIKALSNDPRPSGARKITGSKNDWRIRIGDYRVLYELNDTERTVRVMRVRHRREVYR
ncbi:MAG TPA: type II toxin-antitoxin system RelE/ParE family toxin [Bryobacteraceae bacterium]|nr:type II toxin-antitoxin system RelE/ParE family toxin [Bryobacteraceae bacterium]